MCAVTWRFVIAICYLPDLDGVAGKITAGYALDQVLCLTIFQLRGSRSGKT